VKEQLFQLLDRVDPFAWVAIAIAICWLIDFAVWRLRERAAVYGLGLFRGYNLYERLAKERDARARGELVDDEPLVPIAFARGMK
jgi:hypothetical protein